MCTEKSWSASASARPHSQCAASIHFLNCWSDSRSCVAPYIQNIRIFVWKHTFNDMFWQNVWRFFFGYNCSVIIRLIINRDYVLFFKSLIVCVFYPICTKLSQFTYNCKYMILVTDYNCGGRFIFWCIDHIF